MKSKSVRQAARTKQSLLVDVARTIGSTLGALAAKTTGTPKRAASSSKVRKSPRKAAKNRARRST